MLSNKFGGIAGAAMLGTAALLGTNAAYAIKVNGEDEAAVYAKETVLATDAITEDDVMYYHLMQDHEFRAPALVGASAADRWTVQYDLTGMVFSDGSAALGACGEPEQDEDVNDLTDCKAILDENVSTVRGGQAGDNQVTFVVNGVNIDAAAGVQLIAKLAISAGGSGDLKQTVTNITLSGLGLGNFGDSEMRMGVVKLASAIDEMGTKNTVTTTVGSGFTEFAGNSSVANVGSLMVGVKADHLLANAVTGSAGPLGDLVDNGDTGNEPNSTVVFMGNFESASRVTVDSTASCDSAANDADLRILDSDNMISDAAMTKPIDVDDFVAVMHLCISVDPDAEDLRIKESSYMAMATYGKNANAAFDPMGKAVALGSIVRDGTTVNFPFLTTQTRYNQWLAITNRGAAAADYTLEFEGDDYDDVMRTGDDALPAGETTRFSLRSVLPEGIGSAAGTLIIEAQPCSVDVAIVHVTLGSSTDTVIYDTGCVPPVAVADS
jgi:hypothetical protein